MSRPHGATPRHRGLIVLRGSSVETRERALEVVRRLPREDVAWIGEPDPKVPHACVPGRRLPTVLGRGFDAVVLDAHPGIDADHLGLSHGLIWGNGAFVLRLPEHGCPYSPDARASLAAYPFRVSEVGNRFARHLERALDRAEISEPTSIEPPSHDVTGHAEQEQVVETMTAAWLQPGPTRFVLTADRGRGKSSALGLAIARSRARVGHAGLEIAVTAAGPDAVREVFRFARRGDAADDPRLRFVPLSALVFEPCPFDVIVVDEAAQLPVPLLRRLVECHPTVHLVFSTTTHGYEGTGRGFSLRFVSWLEHQGVPVSRARLIEPIRWAQDDPVERFVFDALLLDAEPASVPDRVPVPVPVPVSVSGSLGVRSERVDRDELVRDEERLRELFGLLVHAHYRTTPKDLHTMLDAPNLDVHVSSTRGRIVAGTIVAAEGGLDPESCEAVARGRMRLRAHALADILVAHLGKTDAGRLKMIRSVRIATHPSLRRARIASALVEHVHRSYQPDLFGTIFGATPGLIAFRRSLGYEVVRLSASRGARTGEPSVMMLRPETAVARRLVTELRAEFARELPRQLALLKADAQTLLDPGLERALGVGLPSPAHLSDQDVWDLAVSYAHGPRTFESIATAASRLIQMHPDSIAELPAELRRVVEARVIDGRGWRRVAEISGLPSVPSAMRALRRAFRQLVAEHDAS